VKKGNWSPEEDYNIFYLFSSYGSKWSKIATHFPGRTENSVKNRFYSTLRRIASESKKQGQSSYTPSLLGDSDIGTSVTSNSLEQLVKYFPQAYEEKKILYKEYKDIKCNDLIKSPHLPKKLLGQKTSRTKTPVTNNKINNTFNINVNITTPTQSASTCANSVHRYENIKMNSIGDLGNMINNFSCEGFLDNYVNNSNSCIPAVNGDLVNNKNIINSSTPQTGFNTNNNDQAISHLLNQLNELESLLNNTKRQLFHYDGKKNYFPIVNSSIDLKVPTLNNDENSSQIIENLFKFEM
jgi:hypothetical protein